MARLDRLGRSKEIAQIAACTGREFHRELLRAVCGRPAAELEVAIAQLLEAEIIADRLLHEAERAADDGWALHAHHAAWSSRLFKGELEATCRHVDAALDLYDAGRHARDCIALGGHDACECGLINGGNAHLLLGRPDRARAMNDAGIEHALSLGIAQSVAHAHNWSLILLQILDDTTTLERRASFLRDTAAEHGMHYYYTEARILGAWLGVRHERDAAALRVVHEFFRRRYEMGTLFVQTFFYWLIGEAELRIGSPQAALATAREGLHRARSTGELLFASELHRLVARCLLAIDARQEAAAEEALQAALADARGRSARLWELRAATTLAEMWEARGEHARAHALLAPVFARFTEGFETPDLKTAADILRADPARHPS